ncbi:MAG: hypothetical protein AB7F23_06870 [Phycisphaerae bacterium]
MKEHTMKINSYLKLVFCTVVLLVSVNLAYAGYPEVQGVNLLPGTSNQAPDYFCTWNIQGYYCSYSSSVAMRDEMVEGNIFGTGQYQNWAGQFSDLQSDLIFVLDDSWDAPTSATSDYLDYYGLMSLDGVKFPSYYDNTPTPAEGLRNLTAAIEARGWKGVGLWVCAQQAPKLEQIDEAEYWAERLKWSHEAGIDYWKVDWGKRKRDLEWRKMLTDLGRIHAPDLIIEHAMLYEAVEFSDVFRTYDVENVISIPVTISRVADLLGYSADKTAKGLVNCEDEPYIAAALGCAIGVMRHEFNGDLPDGTQDFAFPPVGRDLKSRLDCEKRAVRWHRIAAPFGVDGVVNVDSRELEDFWVLGERETYVNRKVGDTIRESAPARVSRGLPLAEISDPDTAEAQPYVLAARYPNGAISIATIGRTLERTYINAKKDITLSIPKLNVPIGIFGEYKSLTFKLPSAIASHAAKVMAQDLAGDRVYDVTAAITFDGNTFTVPGDLISEVGLDAATAGDQSEPGLVIRCNVEP